MCANCYFSFYVKNKNIVIIEKVVYNKTPSHPHTQVPTAFMISVTSKHICQIPCCQRAPL